MKTVLRVLTKSRLILNDYDPILYTSLAFSVCMLLARFLLTGYAGMAFLLWNLFLAWLPYQMVQELHGRTDWIGKKWIFVPVFVVWLLFLPNSFYILTDLFHLRNYGGLMKWFDLTLIVSFAWNGLLLGILAIRQMEKIMEALLGKKSNWLFLMPLMWLIALGVYIGRYLRYNSWDVVTSPFSLASDLVAMIRHPMLNGFEWVMIGFFGLFMYLVYQSLRKISRVFH